MRPIRKRYDTRQEKAIDFAYGLVGSSLSLFAVVLLERVWGALPSLNILLIVLLLVSVLVVAILVRIWFSIGVLVTIPIWLLYAYLASASPL